MATIIDHASTEASSDREFKSSSAYEMGSMAKVMNKGTLPTEELLHELLSCFCSLSDSWDFSASFLL